MSPCGCESLSARGADPQAHHGPLQRLLDGAGKATSRDLIKDAPAVSEAPKDNSLRIVGASVVNSDAPQEKRDKAIQRNRGYLLRSELVGTQGEGQLQSDRQDKPPWCDAQQTKGPCRVETTGPNPTPKRFQGPPACYI